MRRASGGGIDAILRRSNSLRRTASGRKSAPVRLVGIGKPCPCLGQFGHTFWRRLTLNTFEEPLVEGGKEFFFGCHGAMLAHDVSPILE